MKEQRAAIVYFTREFSPEAVMRLYEKINESITGKVGIKLHFGEDGNHYHIRPDFLKELQRQTNATFVETNIIYPGRRQKTESHIALAKEHGFDYAPIDILDSEGEMPLEVSFSHINEAWVGTHLNDYDTYIVCTHFKGHVMSGFGGAIKNISMGMASRSGKNAMHRSHYPQTTPENCISCGLCLESCAADAITLNPLRVHPAECVGCGKCISACPQGCFRMADRKEEKELFMEKLSEYAKSVADNANMVYINFINNISKDCDCFGHPHDPFVHDIGIMASTDPVSIDKASLDMVNEAAKTQDAFLDVNNVSGNHQLDYSEQLGLGTQNYTLIRLDD